MAPRRRYPRPTIFSSSWSVRMADEILDWSEERGSEHRASFLVCIRNTWCITQTTSVTSDPGKWRQPHPPWVGNEWNFFRCILQNILLFSVAAAQLFWGKKRWALVSIFCTFPLLLNYRSCWISFPSFAFSTFLVTFLTEQLMHDGGWKNFSTRNGGEVGHEEIFS